MVKITKLITRITININLKNQEYKMLTQGTFLTINQTLALNKISGNPMYNYVQRRSMFSGVIKKTGYHITPLLRQNTSTNLVKQAGNNIVHNKPANGFDKQLTFSHDRCFASARGGKLIVPKLNKEVKKNTESDITGKHQVSVVISCGKVNCKNTNCTTGSAETNPCNLTSETHKEPLQNVVKELQQAGCQMELSGALTHTIPKNKTGTFISASDIQGKPQIQRIVKEKTKKIIPFDSLKENKKTSNYCQQDAHMASIVRNLPANSDMNKVTPTETTIGQKKKRTLSTNTSR